MMKTSSVPLYFPDGVPPNVQRIEDPDVIHERVAAGLKGADADWKKLSKKADAVTRGNRPWWKRLFGASLKVDLVYVMNMLYKPVSKWPRGLSEREKDDLSVLRALRQYSSGATFPMTDWHRDHAPTDAEMVKAFKLLAKDAGPVVDQAEDIFQKMVTDVGKEVRPLCESVYGEPCDPDEAERVVMADIRDLGRIGVFPSLTPTGTRVMRALWKAMNR